MATLGAPGMAWNSPILVSQNSGVSSMNSRNQGNTFESPLREMSIRKDAHGLNAFEFIAFLSG